MSGAPEYEPYRDEILFKQTVGRYSAAWHHVKPWYYFIRRSDPARYGCRGACCCSGWCHASRRHFTIVTRESGCL